MAVSTTPATVGPLIHTSPPFTIHEIIGRVQPFSVWKDGVLYCYFADLPAAATYCLNMAHIIARRGEVTNG